MNMQERLTKRFFRYAAISSQSIEGAAVVPSTEGQWKLAELLKADLAELGFVVGETITVVNEISGNLILQVKEARIALDKTLAMRIIVA